MGRWWMFGRDAGRRDHSAQLDASGQWPGAMVGLRSAAASGVPESAAPPGWMAGNVPASGRWMPVSIAFVTNKQYQKQLQLTPIGPTDTSTARAQALQAALAASLRGLQATQQ